MIDTLIDTLIDTWSTRDRHVIDTFCWIVVRERARARATGPLLKLMRPPFLSPRDEVGWCGVGCDRAGPCQMKKRMCHRTLPG